MNRNFMIKPTAGYRVNIIGFTRKGTRDESGIPIDLANIRKRFSVDKKGQVYRVEVYKQDKFTGMVMVNFNIPSGFQRRCLSCDAQPAPVPPAAIGLSKLAPPNVLTPDAS